MRCIATFVAIVLCLVISQMVMAQKNICVSLGNVNPKLIPAATLTDMTNRGRGSYTVGVNVCTPTASVTGCTGAGFVAISNATSCEGVFDKAMARPTASKDGFKVKYGSTLAPKNDAEAMILCNPFSKSDDLHSRSKKFATLTPNKVGGTTYMMVLFSHAACSGSRPSPPPSPSSDIPSGGGSSDFPSGGSGSMPSGGSMSSNMPSGGSMSNSDMPSGNSGSMPSGSMPSGGSGGSMPSGGSGDMPSGGSNSGGYIPSGGSGSGESGLIPNTPPNSGSGPNSGSENPAIPSDLPPGGSSMNMPPNF